MYSAKQISAIIINYCFDNGIIITNLKLQKLLYFIQGEYCKYKNSRLIDDDFYAWQLGPVVPKVYLDYSIYSASPIPKQTECTEIDPESELFVEKVLQRYAEIPTWSLVDMSHEQDPWKYNYEIFGDKSIIPFESIKTYWEKNN